MKINELSKELNASNGDIIAYLKKNGFNVSSHMQNATDEMIDLVRAKFTVVEEKKENEKVTKSAPITKKKSDEEIKEPKQFKPDDIIPCRSVTPWKLNAVGVDKNTVYHWEYYGDVDYLSYRDLQLLRRTEYITKPKIIIEDADLCYQWRRELGDTYKFFLGVEYPEQFFDLSDGEFEDLLKDPKTPAVLKEVIKVTARVMMRNENYPSIQKITFIDNILGTCLKDFL